MALVLGALIGIDRELADKPAGLRTHMLVAGASALFILLGESLLRQFHSDSVSIQSDPFRLISAVVLGISFLGAGTIIRRDAAGKVEGLTTAASILIAAAIGICVAVSQFLLAIGVTCLVVGVLRGLHFLERRLRRYAPRGHKPISS
ncbi:MAG: MgtC/SapB family protein [Nitrospirae bacterium]|nr:MAG: MgtC/SapB family protein [Nitrospirota bacterium]